MAHRGVACPDICPGFGLPAQPTGQSGPAGPLGVARRGARARRGHRAHERSRATRWHDRHDLDGGLGAVVALAPVEPGGGGQGGRGRSSPERWRGVEAVEDASGGGVNSGEAPPVMDDVDGVALQCRGRREKVRGESIWTERERVIVLTDNDRWRWCSGGNQRGGGVSGGRSQ
jgi:hypothetical protein